MVNNGERVEGSQNKKGGPQPRKCAEGSERLIVDVRGRGDKPNWQKLIKEQNIILSVMTNGYIYF